MDLPTFGKPTSPTSAITLSSRFTQSSCAGFPGCAYFGTCMVEVAKCIFPRPPLPPFKIIWRWFSPDISAMTLLVSASRITVPSGTFRIRSFASLPWQRFLPPSSPSCALYFVLWRKSTSVLRPLSTSKITSPPRPPSPPSGPPFGTYNSLRKLTWPSPPFPDRIYIFALSANIICPPYLWLKTRLQTKKVWSLC